MKVLSSVQDGGITTPLPAAGMTGEWICISLQKWASGALCLYYWGHKIDAAVTLIFRFENRRQEQMPAT